MPLVDSRDVPFEKEREIFDQLLNDFQSKSEPGSLLLVNTLGWVDGLGAELLEHIFDITQPCLALSLSDDCGTFTIPSWVPKILRIYPIPANTLCRLAMSDKRPTRLQASQLRDLRIISYFSSVLPRPVLSSICDATPYCVKFKFSAICLKAAFYLFIMIYFMFITVCVPEDLSYVDDRYFLATLNVQIVAMCSKPNGQSLKTRRILGDDSLPLVSIIQEGSPLLKCHGFGLIRAVDLEKKMFYVLTPLPLSELSKVEIFARGTAMLVPQLLLESQPAINVPYLSRPALASKSGIIPDLYGELRNVTYQRREYFPQIV
ncbi:Polynucleotide 5'-hydroxyl-kinase nol9 [Parelaphostrongylus tenuis]|uniref:Polynucleotide 5'-hydroxyl-kinase nol9 n=1 Tax=Parelaphostrongylus tenuis TaxID=148309 RepID=A0AAD5N1U8_PARTN|nr:Polynucleotide 5'-hydroxyl-kinase nol9 [Parelaphostrongylus tenuis]